MFKAIAAFGTAAILTSLATPTFAQAKPMGSAASLDGLQERSVSRPSTSAPVSKSPQSSTDVPAGSERGLRLDKKVELIVSPERGTSQLGVYPADDPSSGNKLQVLYQLDQ
ncbi:hypothetical protein [Stenomitos frigidus]|uniref:Uncharacterized protein n=1 Tax=Stenomitos frigidus ULC18 TaxID=2107698 RepID=A0A2T1DUU3_9CYAN|nr:hypothetical protein [Stenomitos frigidus]PSB24268.1 hypothetical protein C7B82_27690 [Stenomitos frigidus ULC18]